MGCLKHHLRQSFRSIWTMAIKNRVLLTGLLHWHQVFQWFYILSGDPSVDACEISFAARNWMNGLNPHRWWVFTLRNPPIPLGFGVRWSRNADSAAIRGKTPPTRPPTHPPSPPTTSPTPPRPAPPHPTPPHPTPPHPTPPHPTPPNRPPTTSPRGGR